MIKKHRIILIADNHPEILSIAKVLSEQDIWFKMFLPPYLLQCEFKFIKKLLNSGEFTSRLTQYTLENDLNWRNVKRPGLPIFLLARGFQNLGKLKLSRKLSNVYFKIVKARAYFERIIHPNATVIAMFHYFGIATGDRRVWLISPTIHPKEQEERNYHVDMLSKNWPKETKTSFSFDLTKLERARNQNVKLICLSEYAKSSFVNQGYLPSSVAVIHSGPRLRPTPDNSRLESVKGRLQVVYVGRLSTAKGIDVFFQIAAKMKSKMDFSILGYSHDQKTEKYIVTIARKLGISIRLNPKEKSEIIEKYQMADVLLFPSFYEGFGMVPAEAMCAGVIPLVSNKSAYPEILRGSLLSQFLIDPENIDSTSSMLEYIDRLDAQHLRNLKHEAIRIGNELSIEKFGRKVYDLIIND